MQLIRDVEVVLRCLVDEIVSDVVLEVARLANKEVAVVSVSARIAPFSFLALFSFGHLDLAQSANLIG